MYLAPLVYKGGLFGTFHRMVMQLEAHPRYSSSKYTVSYAASLRYRQRYDGIGARRYGS